MRLVIQHLGELINWDTSIPNFGQHVPVYLFVEAPTLASRVRVGVSQLAKDAKY